jgi:hypothetical protein
MLNPKVVTSSIKIFKQKTLHPVAGVLDEPFSQLSLLTGVAVQARQYGTKFDPYSYNAFVNGPNSDPN